MTSSGSHLKGYMNAWLLKRLLGLANTAGRLLLFHWQTPSAGVLARGIAYGPDAEQRLDVISAEEGAGRPVLVFFHGGGWLSGDKASYTRVCKQLAQAGVVVFNANYRLGPRHIYPAQLQDAARAVDWACQHAEQFGGDARRAFVAGDSAGAHLAAWVTAALNQSLLTSEIGVEMAMPAQALRGALLFFGVYDFETVLKTSFWNIRTMTHEGFLGTDSALYAERARTASPLRHLSRGCAPLLLCCGEVDPLFPESVALAEQAREMGIPTETLFFSRSEYPEARHAFLSIPFLTCTRQAFTAAIQFIRQRA